jgi:hypothetical protein
MPLDGSLPLARSAQPVSTEVSILSKEARVVRKRSSGKFWRTARVIQGRRQMYNADWYRGFEDDLNEYELNCAVELAQVCAEEKIDLAALRQYISERIMQLEVEEFTREARPRVGDHQASFTYPGESLRETRGQSQNFKEATPMDQAIASPGKSFSEPSTPVPANAEGEYNFLRRILNSWTSPMRVVAGPVQGPVDNRSPRPSAGESQELLDRTEHVRGKKEPMSSFHARTGLGKAQIMEMSREEITRFVAIAEQNAAEEPGTNYFAPKSTSKKIRISLV